MKTMKTLGVLLMLICTSFTLQAQNAETKAANPEDVESLDAIIDALYDVISGPAGEKRDWDRMRSLFIPEGRLIPSGYNQQGVGGYRMWSVDEYVSTAGAQLEASGFFEVEISRVTETYGSVTHIFSTYESRRKADDKDPFTRGINSIQVMNDGSRYWIVNVFWMGENPRYPIPEKYLPN